MATGQPCQLLIAVLCNCSFSTGERPGPAVNIQLLPHGTATFFLSQFLPCLRGCLWPSSLSLALSPAHFHCFPWFAFCISASLKVSSFLRHAMTFLPFLRLAFSENWPSLIFLHFWLENAKSSSISFSAELHYGTFYLAMWYISFPHCIMTFPSE